MRKYAKLTLCGLAAMMLIAGCTKKDDTQTTPAATSSEAESEAAVDKGKVTKPVSYTHLDVYKRQALRLCRRRNGPSHKGYCMHAR